MKKTLFFIFLFTCVYSFGQKQDFCVFDFTNPLGLNPSVTPESGAGARVNVTNTTFTNEIISISFDLGEMKMGAQISTEKTGDDPETYQLRLTTSASMIFKTKEGCHISKIEFSDNSYLGGMSVAESDIDKGILKHNIFSANTLGNTSVRFQNYGKSAFIDNIKVYYITPTDILEPLDLSIKDSTVIPEFTFIDLIFEDNLKILDASGISIINGTDTIANSVGKDYKGNTLTKINASSIDNVIKVSVDAPITEDGTYTITIPAKSFESEDGYHNAELKYTFTVKTPKNTFNYTSLSLETGRVESISPSIILTYPTVVEIEVSKPIRMFKDGEYFGGVKLSKVVGNDSQVMLEIQGYTEAITDLGVYTIEIPEATIYNNSRGDEEFERYNPAFTLEYIISNDPPEDTEVMKAAKALLLKSGLGYPKETSAKRLALKALTEAEEIPADDQLTAAIGEFYNETDVVLPDSGVWYTIASVNANGDKLYLYYNDGVVTLTDDAKKATAFMADSLKTSTSFKTIDGKYLHVLSAAQDGKFDATSSKNVTETYDSLVNNLVLAKLAVKEVDSVKTFGLFSLYGSLGKDIISEVPMSTYAQISHTNKTVISDPNYPLLYTENNTGAFVLEQTEKPEILAEPVKLACSLNPSIVADNSELITLSFVSDTTVYISTDTAAYITKKGSDKKVVEEVVFTGVSNNSFTFAVAGLEKGNYELVIPEGLFYVMTKAGMKALIIPENRKLPFAIGKGGSGTDGGFNYNYDFIEFYGFDPNCQYQKDDLFSNYYIFTEKGYRFDDLIADPDMEVVLVRYNSLEDTLARAHFESCVIPEKANDNISALKLVFDTELPKLKGSYSLIFDAGTYGDSNFGKYLKDRTSVKASDCIVNTRVARRYIIDNELYEQTLGMKNIDADINSSSSIYDLFGRKLDKITSNGIYIINGKKVVVRNKSK